MKKIIPLLTGLTFLLSAGLVQAQDWNNSQQNDTIKARDTVKEDLNDIGTQEDSALKNNSLASPSAPDGQQIHETVGSWARQGSSALDSLPSIR